MLRLQYIYYSKTYATSLNTDMDLLGSILGSMEKPPTLDDEHRKKAKEQKALVEKHREAEKKTIDVFRQQIHKRIQVFIKNGTLEKLKMEPMEKVVRAVVHEVAEVAGLASFSFGEEDEDRYVMMWKKEFAPSDEELLAHRKGEDWNPEKASELKRLKELEELEQKAPWKNIVQVAPASNYRDKYKHLIGEEAAKDAAREMVSNSSYGNVPATNKRDQRTIEQVLADTRAKKKQKLDITAAETNVKTMSSNLPTSGKAVSSTTHVSDPADELTSPE